MLFFKYILFTILLSLLLPFSSILSFNFFWFWFCLVFFIYHETQDIHILFSFSLSLFFQSPCFGIYGLCRMLSINNALRIRKDLCTLFPLEETPEWVKIKWGLWKGGIDSFGFWTVNPGFKSCLDSFIAAVRLLACQLHLLAPVLS